MTNQNWNSNTPESQDPPSYGTEAAGSGAESTPGYTPPAAPAPYGAPASGGYTPPASGGYAPPASGGYTPPAQGATGGYTPPAQGATGGYTPPASGGYGAPTTPYGQEPAGAAPSQNYGAPAGQYGAPGGTYGTPSAYPAPGGYTPQPYPGGGAPGNLADWVKRAQGGLVDYVLPSIVFSLLTSPFAPRLDANTGTMSGGGFLYTLIGTILPLAWMLFNSGWKQGTTGQTFGKQWAKTRLVSEATGQPIGFGMAVVRQIAHFVDIIICGIGVLFPLWDPKKQTIADKIMKTVVITD